ncbi:MAG: response regulator [Planctomycetaceae bacterium]
MPRLLIVDDNPLDLKLAAKCVADLELETLTAADGREALDLLERTRPDAVLTDLDMPEVDGLELVREIRKTYPTLPVVLMTAKGSEEIAAAALQAGAASYVPKRNMKTELGDTLRVVLDIAALRKQRQQVLEIVTATESRFRLGYEPHGPSALVNYCQDALRMMRVCNDADLVRVGTALGEAIVNAVEHGNLELDSELREQDDGRAYANLREQRLTESPYKDRHVDVVLRLTRVEAVFTVRDEGRGFNPELLSDPTDPQSLMRPYGRGLMLIRTFMDRVWFNDKANEITMIKRRKSG